MLMLRWRKCGLKDQCENAWNIADIDCQHIETGTEVEDNHKRHECRGDFADTLDAADDDGADHYRKHDTGNPAR